MYEFLAVDEVANWSKGSEERANKIYLARLPVAGKIKELEKMYKFKGPSQKKWVPPEWMDVNGYFSQKLNTKIIHDFNSILNALRRESMTMQKRWRTADADIAITSEEVERFFSCAIQALLHDTPYVSQFIFGWNSANGVRWETNQIYNLSVYKLPMNWIDIFTEKSIVISPVPNTMNDPVYYPKWKPRYQKRIMWFLAGFQQQKDVENAEGKIGHCIQNLTEENETELYGWKNDKPLPTETQPIYTYFSSFIGRVIANGFGRDCRSFTYSNI